MHDPTLNTPANEEGVEAYVGRRVCEIYREGALMTVVGLVASVALLLAFIWSHASLSARAIWSAWMLLALVLLIAGGWVERAQQPADRYGVPFAALIGHLMIGLGWGGFLLVALSAAREDPVLAWQVATVQMAISAGALASPNGSGTLTMLVVVPMWTLAAVVGLVVGMVSITVLFVLCGVVMGRDLSTTSRRVLGLIRLQYLAEQAAERDPLTGLLNRAGLATGASHLDLSHSIVFFIDLDGFKQVNDTRGHDAGDRLLQQIARRLSDAMRTTDLIARLGGDEFVIIAQGQTQVAELADRLHAVIVAPIAIDGEHARVTASVGIAHGARSADLDDLLRDADEAMREAKRTGRSRSVVHGG